MRVAKTFVGQMLIRLFFCLLFFVIFAQRTDIVASRFNLDFLRSHTKKLVSSIAVGLAISAGSTYTAHSAYAADTVAVGKCLIKSCKKELAQCILNPKCLANVVCLNLCNGRKDEPECQIKCGDQFENDVVGTFNSCAVSQKKCVPQKQNEGLYPPPSPQSLVKQFDTSIMNGRWYISAGLNKAFDTFDCQVHFFNSPSPGLFFAKLNWRVTEPDGEFFTKNAVQRFVQDPKNPAHLINHDNEYLHYKDDWYVLDYEPDDFVLVYYMGSNDAWDGYGGAFVYSRAPTIRPELIPRLEAAVERMGLKYKWSDFVLTDNTCKPEAESPTILREKYATRLLITEEQQLQEQLTAARNAAVNNLFGKTATSTLMNSPTGSSSSPTRQTEEKTAKGESGGTQDATAATEVEKAEKEKAEKEAEAAAVLQRSVQYLEKELEIFQQEVLKDAALLEQGLEKELGIIDKNSAK